MSNIVKDLFDDITANERIYFRFIRKLSYIFTELSQIESLYSERLLRLTQFLKRNEYGIENYPIDKIRNTIENHLMKEANYHLELSNKICNEMQNKVKEIIDKDTENKNTFETRKLTIDQSFIKSKKEYEKMQEKYFSAAENVAKDFIKNKKDNSNQIDNKTLTKALNYQSELLVYVNQQSKERKSKIDEYKKIVNTYKDNNAISIKELHEVFRNYLTIYKKQYDDSSNLMSESLNKMEEVKLTETDYYKMYEDITELSNFPKLEFVSFTSGHDMFLLKECKDIGITDEATIKEIKLDLMDKLGTEIPEFHDKDNNVTIRYHAINDIVENIIKGHYNKETIKNVEAYNYILEDYPYMLFFLRILNKNRAKLIDIHLDVYSCFEEIMKGILKKLKEKGSKENRELFFETIEYIVILSQTFYTKKQQNEERRTLLQDEISQEPIWKDEQIWIDMITYHIEIDKIKQNVNFEKDYIIRQNSIINIVIPSLTTFLFNMKSFVVGDEITKSVMNKMKEKYNLSDETIAEMNKVN